MPPPDGATDQGSWHAAPERHWPAASRDQLFTTKITTKALESNHTKPPPALVAIVDFAQPNSGLAASKSGQKGQRFDGLRGVELTQNRREGMRGSEGIRGTRP